MKQFGLFLKMTALGGLFVLIPVVFVLQIFEHALQIARGAAKAIMEALPRSFVSDDPRFPVLLAILLLLIVSFIVGLLAHSNAGRIVGNWIEDRVLRRVPGYRAIKSLTRSFTNAEQADGFKAALFTSLEHETEIVYLIEEGEDGYATVMIPGAPTPLTGSVKIVRRDQITPLHASLGDITRVLGEYGIGAQALLKKTAGQARLK